MPTDYSLEVRRAVVRHLINDPGVTALVSADRIYGEQSPAEPQWPFIRLGFLISGPFEAQGWDGSEHRLTVHCFAHGPYTDAVLRMNRAVVEAMQTLSVPGLGTVDLQWRSPSETIRDTDEAEAYHGINSFDLVVAV